MTAPRALVVVIPARNEEALVGRCLDSVIAARDYLGDRRSLRGRSVPPVHIVVVADGCTDDTVAIARERPDVTVVEVESGGVGRARRTGVSTGLAASDLRALPQNDVWIANTDADSAVPRDWLYEQFVLARRGVDLVIGTVRPEFDDLTPAQIRAWEASHIPGAANGHVHGANLGLRASIYLAAGGFPSLAEHEDVDLVARCVSLGCTAVATDRFEVTTSGRQVGRTPGGYARYLRSDLLA